MRTIKIEYVFIQALVIFKNIIGVFIFWKKVIKIRIKVRLDINSYLINCKIVKIIKRYRTIDEAANYDLVEVECENWKDIRQIFFDNSIGTPEEMEDGEIVLWDIQEIKSNKHDIYSDIEQVRKILDVEEDNIVTHEVRELLFNIKEFVDKSIKELYKREGI